MILVTPAAKPADFADLVNLLQVLTETTAALRKLEGKVTARYIDTVTDSVEEYKRSRPSSAKPRPPWPCSPSAIPSGTPRRRRSRHRLAK
jgi:hypothetical protein